MNFNFVFTLCLLLFAVSANALDIYGHRGARGLAPENTIPGYKKALEIGVDFVDMDVVMTKDKVLVVQHDLTLNPNITRDKHGHWIQRLLLIKNLNLKELQTYDVGRIKPNTKYKEYFPLQRGCDRAVIPTLKEVIAFVKSKAGDRVGFQIEIKTDPAHPELTYSPKEIAAELAKIIHDENIVDRTQVQAFDWRCLLALQKIDSRIITAYLTDTDMVEKMHDTNADIAGLSTAGKLVKNFNNSVPQMVKALGGKYWEPQDIQVTVAQIQEAHKLGLKVVVWSDTQTSGKDIDVPLIKKIINMGVDGIITDRPDVLKSM